MAKLLITGCEDGRQWYLPLIGENLELMREYETHYSAKEPGGCANIVYKCDAEIVRPIKYSTEDRYGTPTLEMLAGEVKYIEIRLKLLEDTLTRENNRHSSVRDSHLITQILKDKNFWNERIKEIECY